MVEDGLVILRLVMLEFLAFFSPLLEFVARVLLEWVWIESLLKFLEF